jgi:hypothetical protein
VRKEAGATANGSATASNDEDAGEVKVAEPATGTIADAEAKHADGGEPRRWKRGWVMVTFESQLCSRSRERVQERLVVLVVAVKLVRKEEVDPEQVGLKPAEEGNR